MKKLFINIKPFITYWVTFAIIYSFAFFGNFDVSIRFWDILYVSSVCILNFLTGFFDGIQKCKTGIIIYSCQLIISEILPFFGIKHRIVVFGNLIGSCFYHSNSEIINVLFAFLSCALPIAPFFIGDFCKKRYSAAVSVTNTWFNKYKDILK